MGCYDRNKGTEKNGFAGSPMETDGNWPRSFVYDRAICFRLWPEFREVKLNSDDNLKQSTVCTLL